MQRLAIAAAVVAMLIAAPISAAHARCPFAKRLYMGDSQAEVSLAPEPGCADVAYYGRARGAKRTYQLGLPPSELGGGSAGTGGIEELTLAGTMVAFEELNIGGAGNSLYEDRVLVRNLRTGHVVHGVPSGSPLRPEPFYVGVGKVVSLLLRSDGSAAWIAQDYERTPELNSEHPFFDVEAVDASGTHLLASGIDIDPSSLSLASGAKDVDLGSSERRVDGELVYWTQAGAPRSAALR
jgi:hypothetical protein